MWREFIYAVASRAYSRVILLSLAKFGPTRRIRPWSRPPPHKQNLALEQHKNPAHLSLLFLWITDNDSTLKTDFGINFHQRNPHGSASITLKWMNGPPLLNRHSTKKIRPFERDKNARYGVIHHDTYEAAHHLRGPPRVYDSHGHLHSSFEGSLTPTTPEASISQITSLSVLARALRRPLI